MNRYFYFFTALLIISTATGCNINKTLENKNLKVTGYEYIIDRQFDNAFDFKGDYAIIKNKEKYGLIDRNGAVIFQPDWSNAPHLSEGLICKEIDNGINYVDLKDNIVISGEGWLSGSEFNNGVAIITKKKGNILVEAEKFLIDTTGKKLSDTWSDILGDWTYGNSDTTFKNGIARVKKDTGNVIMSKKGSIRESKFGLINLKGELIIKPQFDSIGEFVSGYSKVFNYIEGIEKYGVIDKTGKTIIPTIYDEIKLSELSYEPNFKLIAVKKNGFWGFVDIDNNIVIDLKWDDVNIFRDGLAAVKKDSLWGVIDQTGKLIVDTQYQDIDDFENGYATICKNNLYGFINGNGKVVAEPQWKNILIWDSNPNETGFYSKKLYNNLAVVQTRDSTYQMVDVNGKIVINDFEAVIQAAKNRNWVDENKYALPVKRNGVWQLISMGNKLLSKDYYGDMSNFVNGFAKVKTNGKYGYIDINGNEVIVPRFDDAGDFIDGIAKVKIDGKWGYIKLKYQQ